MYKCMYVLQCLQKTEECVGSPGTTWSLATMWMLGFEFGSSRRIASALNHWASSPGQDSIFNFFIEVLCVSYNISQSNLVPFPALCPLPHQSSCILPYMSFIFFSVFFKIFDAKVYCFEQKFTVSVSSLTQSFFCFCFCFLISGIYTLLFPPPWDEFF